MRHAGSKSYVGRSVKKMVGQSLCVLSQQGVGSYKLLVPTLSFTLDCIVQYSGQIIEKML